MKHSASSTVQMVDGANDRSSQGAPDAARGADVHHGTRLIAKSGTLLRLIANANQQGARLVDLTLHSGLERPTVRRILKGLIDEGLVHQDEANRRYFLGTLLFELGVAAVHRNRLTAIAAPSLTRLARATGESVYLVQRSGMDAVCLDRRDGCEPFNVSTIDIGSRRPLGAAAGSLAILMRLSVAEQQRVLAANRTQMAYYERVTGESTLDAVARSTVLGFALMPTNVMPYTSGVGVAVETGSKSPSLALSVSALSDRIMHDRRYLALAALLEREAEVIRDALSQSQ